MVLCVGLLSGCSGPFTNFAPSKWGAASPRVATWGAIPKGGGREMVGEPYQVAGRWYTPRVETGYDRTGYASWYGANFHGRLTANGEVFDQNAVTAAHPTLPLPSYVRVTNLGNNRSLIVRVNDRGPFVADRMIDLSRKSAEMLGYINKGVARVRVQYVGPAPLAGDDTRILLASLNALGGLDTGGGTAVAASGASRRSEPALTTIGRLLTDPLSVLSYAEDGSEQTPVSTAFAAAEALAIGAELETWREGADIDRRQIDVEIGTFASGDDALRIARAFALIAAVETFPVEAGGAMATRIRLNWLKPGATRADLVNLADSLGLEDVAIPD